MIFNASPILSIYFEIQKKIFIENIFATSPYYQIHFCVYLVIKILLMGYYYVLLMDCF